jgi:hypothetical protein
MNEEEKLTPIPADMQVEESKNTLIIKYVWNKNAGYISFLFSLIWLGFIYFGFINQILSEDVPPFVLLFMMPFVVVGFYLFYYGLANIFNTTTITIDFDNINIKHAPLFWVGNRDVYKHDLKQIYVKQHTHKNRNHVSYSYSVNAIDRENKEVKLVSGLQTPEQGKWIEQKMENFLKIQNKPVNGEYTP